jgi:hypothetical protein
MIERMGSRIYTKIPILRGLVKSLAKANSYRDLIHDVKFYPSLKLSD